MINKSIGFIGCNNMSGAILQGILVSKIVSKEKIYVYDISPTVTSRVKAMGVQVVGSNKELCAKSDIIILGTKPQHAREALSQCEGWLNGKALVSIVAGITIKRLQEMVIGKPRVLRTMPNTPAMVSAGVTIFCRETDLLTEERLVITEVFGVLGTVEWMDEKLINAAAAISGSGPAYVAMFIEALADGGVKNGLSREVAYRLATRTFFGSAKLLLERGMHPGELKDMVTSPGGTTIEGVEALEKGGMRYAIMDCVNVATEKASKL